MRSNSERATIIERATFLGMRMYTKPTAVAMRARQLQTRFKRFIERLLAPEPRVFPGAAPKKEWSIGIYSGESPFHFEPCQGINNPVLTRYDVSDVLSAGVADPFMLKVQDTWYMFFEVMNWQNLRGEIGLASSADGMTWTYQQIVLAEPFHLSYPYVFEWQDDYYMIPESHKIESIRLYKASQFPTQWSCISTLLTGKSFMDASVCRYEKKWWLFTETNPTYKCDLLRLYYADELTGPWYEHPKSPLIEGNMHIARPAGRILLVNDKLVRYAQDCYPHYGTQVRKLEITELSTAHYRQREIDEGVLLKPAGTGWNGSGMHHIDPHLMDDGRWLACVDGWLLS